MKLRTAILGAALALAACTGLTPLPIAAGDICFSCRRVVVEPKLAAEMIDPAGRAFKFRTAACLAGYLKQHPEEKGTIFVTDFKTGRLIPANQATFVPTMIGQGRERTQEFVAYKASADAKQAAVAQAVSTTDWSGVIAAAPAN